jgi:hypothetical protein
MQEVCSYLELVDRLAILKLGDNFYLKKKEFEVRIDDNLF